ncbi:hypothetical protein RRG08_056022 [Elysia crispata]|uniref:Uncharacterized protein n=1 Tax=Elysia crispata TaxID=231223 RepID=A0AAE1AHP0_9GAST|nr:hypothetical protein RRG08_056022 [Elysia crispata]
MDKTIKGSQDTKRQSLAPVLLMLGCWKTACPVLTSHAPGLQWTARSGHLAGYGVNMSAAKMVADSTQAELVADAGDGRKRKKKIKKAGKKVVLPEDEDSDLDLKRELRPLGDFIKDRPAMIREMFRAVRGASLSRALPDLLKVHRICETFKVFCDFTIRSCNKKISSIQPPAHELRCLTADS